MENCTGCLVWHKIHGTGRIVEWDYRQRLGRGWIITVEFPDLPQKNKRIEFLYPRVFQDGFLRAMDARLYDQIRTDIGRLASGQAGNINDVLNNCSITGIHVKASNCMLYDPSHVSLGWSKLGDMSDATEDYLYEIYRVCHKPQTLSDVQVRTGVKQVYRFLSGITPGDIVVFFSNRRAYFGLVESGYYYRHFGTDDPDYMNHKDTKWFFNEGYGELPSLVQRFLNVPKSVFPLDTKYADKSLFFNECKGALARLIASGEALPLMAPPDDTPVVTGEEDGTLGQLPQDTSNGGKGTDTSSGQDVDEDSDLGLWLFK